MKNGHNFANLLRPTTDRDWHIHFVYHDPDFHDDFKTLQVLELRGDEKVIAVMREKIKRKFALSDKDINLYDIGQTLFIANLTGTSKLSLDTTKKKWSIEFDPITATRADVLREFIKFEDIRNILFPQKKRTGPKGTHNPALVFAIFKARQAKKTFKEIFAMYQSGELQGYKGSTTQYRSEDQLERFYNRHKP